MLRNERRSPPLRAPPCFGERPSTTTGKLSARGDDMTQKLLPIVLISLLLPATGFATTSEKAIRVAGTVSGGPGSIWIQIQDAGTTVCARSLECVISDGQSATTVRNCIGAGWDEDPRGGGACPDTMRCSAQGADIIVISANADFTTWATSDTSGTWTQITPSTSFTNLGITLSWTSVPPPPPIPTLSEWGVILLTVLVVAAGVLAIRRQRVGVVS